MRREGGVQDEDVRGLFVDGFHPGEGDGVGLRMETCDRTTERVDPEMVPRSRLGRVGEVVCELDIGDELAQTRDLAGLEGVTAGVA